MLGIYVSKVESLENEKCMLTAIVAEHGDWFETSLGQHMTTKQIRQNLVLLKDYNGDHYKFNTYTILNNTNGKQKLTLIENAAKAANIPLERIIDYG